MRKDAVCGGDAEPAVSSECGKRTGCGREDADAGTAKVLASATRTGWLG